VDAVVLVDVKRIRTGELGGELDFGDVTAGELQNAAGRRVGCIGLQHDGMNATGVVEVYGRDMAVGGVDSHGT
jgi:hypothetical protein